MLNDSVGTIETKHGRRWLRNRPGADGHALYGPYVRLEPGNYTVEFELALHDSPKEGEDLVCCFADVTADMGRKEIAREPVLASQVRDGRPFQLGFSLDQSEELEFRIHVNGRVSLSIADDARVKRAEGPGSAPAAPVSFMADDKPMMKRLHEMGVRMAVSGDRLVMDKLDVRFNARVYDDVNFVHELFTLNVYNVFSKRPACIIDIGMNVALASLLFATKPNVQEIHAFEPFADTFSRGLANLELNPELARKIHPCNFGLSDGMDGLVTFQLNAGEDSGGRSTFDCPGGAPMQLPMRDAAATLAPIIARAKEQGLEVIVKIDCEGSEFAIFESLSRAGLFGQISALMVEWHRVFEGRTQEELIAPLLEEGFLIFDLTPSQGNGFFYAVRTAPQASMS